MPITLCTPLIILLYHLVHILIYLNLLSCSITSHFKDDEKTDIEHTMDMKKVETDLAKSLKKQSCPKLIKLQS